MTNKNFLFAGALLAALPLSAATGEDGGAVPGPAELVSMEAIALPIVDGARLQGTLHFQLVLEVETGPSSDDLSANMPALRAEALAAGAEFARLSASPFIAIDAQRLSADLTLALRERQAGIARVLLVEVSAKSI